MTIYISSSPHALHGIYSSSVLQLARITADEAVTALTELLNRISKIVRMLSDPNDPRRKPVSLGKAIPGKWAEFPYVYRVEAHFLDLDTILSDIGGIDVSELADVFANADAQLAGRPAKRARVDDGMLLSAPSDVAGTSTAHVSNTASAEPGRDAL